MQAVKAWVEIEIATVLLFRYEREHRLPSLCAAFQQQCAGSELKYRVTRLKTFSGIAKLKRLLVGASPPEFRTNVIKNCQNSATL